MTNIASAETGSTMHPSRTLVVLALIGNIPVLVASPPEHVPWRAYEDPVFPLQFTPTTLFDGFASVVFTFDENGRVTDRVALRASNPAFVTAVFEAARHWEVDTTKLPRFLRRETVHYAFKRDQVLILRTQREAMKGAFSPYGDEKGFAFETCHEDQLETPLQLVTSVAPEFPEALKNRHARGSATVNFIVDAEGRVRVPAVTDATEPEFAAAVIGAVRQWRFAPAQLGGRPIQVMVDRTFRFGAPAAAK
jgi:TonB family protein